MLRVSIWHAMETNNPFETLLGLAPEFRGVLRAARLVAATEATCLILGETGTGKELLARAMHVASPRAPRPFVTVDCAAIPETLAESELFGHRKGAFTGAVAHHAGRLTQADGGTLFLDEIGELPLSSQAKLLRFLESGECQAIGELRPRRLNVRVCAAMHRDLYAEVKRGTFRQDLYFRLKVVPLQLPPLRARPGDVALLLEELTALLAKRHGLPPPEYSREAVDCLKSYPWPGKVRELRNLCERMVVLAPGRRITASDLPGDLLGPRETAAVHFTLPAQGVRLGELEAEMIRQALVRSSGNRSRAARLLGISRDALLYRMQKHAIP
jgi:DNA-binding NtrC family response regulator